MVSEHLCQVRMDSLALFVALRWPCDNWSRGVLQPWLRFRQKFCSFAGPQVMVVSERSFDLPLAFSCSGRWCHSSRWYLSSYSFQGYACAASSISDTPVQQLLASRPPNEVLNKRMFHATAVHNPVSQLLCRI